MQHEAVVDHKEKGAKADQNGAGSTKAGSTVQGYSVGLDFTVNATHMYGIPQRADTFRLEETGFDVDRTIDEVMQREPRTIGPQQLASEALQRMKAAKLDQILVVDDDGLLIGLLDVQDLLAVDLI